MMEIESNINTLDPKKEEDFCNLVSSFRTSLGQLNTFLIDVIKYHKSFKKPCKIFANINNIYIKKFVLPNEAVHDELTHYRSTSIIQQYLTRYSEKVLDKFNEKIDDIFDDFMQDSKSPYNGLSLKKPESKESLKKKLDQYKNTITDSKRQPRVYDDYFDDISLIYKRDCANDDDEEEDSEYRPDRRFFKDPYPSIPKEDQYLINQFMTYVNFLILLRIILSFSDKFEILSQKHNIPVPAPMEEDTTDIEDFEEIVFVDDEDKTTNLEKKNNILIRQLKELKSQHLEDIKKLEEMQEKINKSEQQHRNDIKKQKDQEKIINKLEEELDLSQQQIRDLLSKIDDLTAISAKDPTESINAESDEVYALGFSKFRKAIDNMNSGFVELIKHRKPLKKSCQAIAKINNQFVHNVVSDSSKDLTHYARFNNIYNYYLMKNDSDVVILNLLENLREEIRKTLDTYEPFNENEFNTKRGFSQAEIDSIDKVKKYLKDAKEKAIKIDFKKNHDIFDDFIEEKIEPIYTKENFDDEDDDQPIEKRYFGKPYQNIPPIVKKKVDHYLSLVNSLISLSVIVDFDKYVNEVILGRLTKSNDKNIQTVKLYNDMLSELKSKDTGTNDLIPIVNNLSSSALEIATEVKNYHDQIYDSLLSNDIH